MSSKIGDAVDDQMSNISGILFLGALGTGVVMAIGFGFMMASSGILGTIIGLLITVAGSVLWIAAIIRAAGKVVGHSVKAAIIEAEESTSTTSDWTMD